MDGENYTVRSLICCVLIRVIGVRRVGPVEYLAHMGGVRNSYRMLARKPGRKQNASQRNSVMKLYGLLWFRKGSSGGNMITNLAFP
jgi:hypothetical protein